jgi:methyl-accepting chemotaxis protein
LVDVTISRVDAFVA